MKTRYKVRIVRTIETVVYVDAISSHAARETIIAYGPTEAISDYPVESEDCSIRVMKPEIVK